MHKLLCFFYFKGLKALSIPRNWLYCAIKGVKYDLSWHFCGLPYIQMRKNSKIVIGRNFKSCSKIKWNSIGVFQPTILKTGMPGARLQIGNDVGVSGCTISAAKSITIGNHVLIGSGALITDGDAHPIDWRMRRENGAGNSKPIVIEDDVFIGARAIILKGVILGRGCVIGAGSVVTKDVPPEKIAAGNPAKVIGDVK